MSENGTVHTASLRFFVRWMAVTELVTLGEDAALRSALNGMSKRRRPRLRSISTAPPAGAGLIWVGDDAAPERLVAGKLYLAARLSTLTRDPEATAIWLPSGPAAGADGLAMAMRGRLSEAETRTLDAIASASESKAPTSPVDEAVGRLLYLLVRAGGLRRVLDVGVSAGASTLWLAAAMRHVGGRVVGVERDSQRHAMARRNVKQAGHGALVELHVGDLVRRLPKLEEGFEMVFLDEGLEDRSEHFEALLPSLSPGALVVAQGGREEASRAAQYHAVVQLSPRVASSLRLALGEGLSLTLLNT